MSKEKKKPDPNSPNYWLEVEEQTQNEETERILEEHRKRTRLTAKVDEVKRRLPESTKEQLRKQIRASAPSSMGLGLDCPKKDEHWVEAEVNRAITKIAEPIAEAELQREALQKRRGRIGYKRARLNPPALRGNTAPRPVGAPQLQQIDTSHTRKMLTYLVETTLRDMGTHTRVIRQFPLSELMLKRTTVNFLQSCIASWNGDLETLHMSDEKYKVLESLEIPIETDAVARWIRKIQNNEVLNDKWIEAMSAHLKRFLGL